MTDTDLTHCHWSQNNLLGQSTSIFHAVSACVQLTLPQEAGSPTPAAQSDSAKQEVEATKQLMAYSQANTIWVDSWDEACTAIIPGEPQTGLDPELLDSQQARDPSTSQLPQKKLNEGGQLARQKRRAVSTSPPPAKRSTREEFPIVTQLQIPSEINVDAKQKPLGSKDRPPQFLVGPPTKRRQLSIQEQRVDSIPVALNRPTHPAKCPLTSTSSSADNDGSQDPGSSIDQSAQYVSS